MVSIVNFMAAKFVFKNWNYETIGFEISVIDQRGATTSRCGVIYEYLERDSLKNSEVAKEKRGKLVTKHNMQCQNSSSYLHNSSS